MSMFFDVQERVLYEIWDLAYDPNQSNPLSKRETGQFRPEGVSDVIARKAVDALANRGMIEILEDFGDEFEISAKGISYVESQLGDFGSEITTYSNEKNSRGYSAASAPASDRVVTLDDNSAGFQETIASLDELAHEARQSNEYGELFADPTDRIRTLDEIDSGISLLKKLRVKVSAIQELLVSNLRTIIEKLPDATLGALASRALDGLLKLFESP